MKVKRRGSTRNKNIAQLVFYWAANPCGHSEVLDGDRYWLLRYFRDVLQIFENTKVPQHMSLQNLDFSALGRTCGVRPEDFVYTALFEAPYSHLLPSAFGRNPRMRAHLEWQFSRRVQSNIAQRTPLFCPEFDIPSQGSILGKQRVLPASGKFGYLYSACKRGDARPDDPMSKYKALKLHDNLIVPMGAATDVITGAWFNFQRFPTDEYLEKVIDAIRTFAYDSAKRGQLHIFFIDLESVFVGGDPSLRQLPKRGFELHERLFAAIEAAGLTEVFTTIEEAVEYWDEVAVKAPYDHIARDYGVKWTKNSHQLDLIMEWGSLPEPVTERDHKEMSLAVWSDGLSALGRKIGRPLQFIGRSGQFEAPHCQTIINVTMAAVRARQEGRDLADDLRNLESTDAKLPMTPDGTAYVNILADILEAA